MVFWGGNESGCGNQALSLRMCHLDFKAGLVMLVGGAFAKTPAL